jgi:hypothetical protein
LRAEFSELLESCGVLNSGAEFSELLESCGSRIFGIARILRGVEFWSGILRILRGVEFGVMDAWHRGLEGLGKLALQGKYRQPESITPLTTQNSTCKPIPKILKILLNAV